MARRASRVDENQPEVVKDLRAMGFSVKPTHMVADGFPDIACGFQGRTFLFEIKDPAKIPSKRQLTPAEREFHEVWRGHCAVIHTAVEAANIMRLSCGMSEVQG